MLASFTASGSTNPDGDGTGLAPFLGIVSDAPFAKIGFSIDSATSDTAYFGIDRVSIRTASTAEPPELAFIGFAAAGLLAAARRRQARSVPRQA